MMRMKNSATAFLLSTLDAGFSPSGVAAALDIMSFGAERGAQRLSDLLGTFSVVITESPPARAFKTMKGYSL